MKSEEKVFTDREVAESYCNPQATERYAAYFKLNGRHTRKDKREKRCVAKALAAVPQGGLVLDLPCGAGRMYPLLKQLGYHVASADVSPYMVDAARKYVNTLGGPTTRDSFCVADVLNTGFQDKQFDAVLCNRLFHHLSHADTRQQALRELSRICSGPIIVSFFSTFATDVIKHYIKKHILHEVIKDRIPISPFTFTSDVRAAGLTVSRWLPARPLISKQWYVVLQSPDAKK